MKQKRKADSRPSHGWAIVVRVADGSRSYYYLDERYHEARGTPLERWGRESQALRFPSEDEARSVVAQMQLNSAAKKYEVVRLPQARR